MTKNEEQGRHLYCLWWESHKRIKKFERAEEAVSLGNMQVCLVQECEGNSIYFFKSLSITNLYLHVFGNIWELCYGLLKCTEKHRGPSMMWQ